MSLLKLSRYEQQIELPEIGIEGQKKIFNSRVLIVGAGGLGCPASTYLAGAGVGSIGIIDGDIIEPWNLHRQTLYFEQDIGQKKVEVALKRLKHIAPDQDIHAYSDFLTENNADQIIGDYDIVLDATDNHIARLLINKTCLKQNKLWVYGALYRYEGQICVFGNPSKPCFSCLFPNITDSSTLPTCKTSGILSPVPGIVGSMQALEVLKIILGLQSENIGLRIYNFLRGDLVKFQIEKNKNCSTCSVYNI